jgi:chromosome segregation ATPase
MGQKLSVQERRVMETEKQRTRRSVTRSFTPRLCLAHSFCLCPCHRSIGYQEERTLRLAVQQELAHTKTQAAAATELLNARLDALETQLAAARTQTQFAEASADLVRRELTTVTAQLAAARAEARDYRERAEASERATAQATAETAAERAAYLRLEQLWAVAAHKSEVEVAETRERLHAQRAEALQASQASVTSEHARTAETTARRHAEEMLELERVARRAVEAELARYKGDDMPALQQAVRERESALAQAQREVAAAQERVVRLEVAEADVARQQQALADALQAAQAERTQLAAENEALREAMDNQAARDRQTRLKLERDLELLQRAVA